MNKIYRNPECGFYFCFRDWFCENEISKPQMKNRYLHRNSLQGDFSIPHAQLLSCSANLRMMSRFSVLAGQLERWETVLSLGIFE